MWTCWICNALGCGKHYGNEQPASVDVAAEGGIVVEPPKSLSVTDSIENPSDRTPEVKRTPSDPAQFVHHVASDATVQVLETEEVVFTKTPSVRRFSEKIQARQDQIGNEAF